MSLGKVPTNTQGSGAPWVWKQRFKGGIIRGGNPLPSPLPPFGEADKQKRTLCLLSERSERPTVEATLRLTNSRYIRHEMRSLMFDILLITVIININNN